MKIPSICIFFTILFTQNSYSQLSHAFKICNTELIVEQGDIIESKTEAIVAAANEQLVGSAILNAASWPELQHGCNQCSYYNDIRCPIEKACDLREQGIKYMIRAVDPDDGIVEDVGQKGSLLILAYKNPLILADKHNIKSIAFPFLGSDCQIFSREQVAEIAINTIVNYLSTDTDIVSIHVVLSNQEDFDLFCLVINRITCQMSGSFENFYDVKKACDRLPSFDLQQSNPCQSFLNENIFIKELDDFFNTTNDQFNEIKWINNKPIIRSNEFQAFVEKRIIPANSIVAIHGDIHGDIHSLNNFLETFIDQGFLDNENPFKIKKKNFYFLFLGDYVDRGWYGAEVIYVILRLKNENPNNVFLVRGNHEDINLNGRYGFSKEVQSKFSSIALSDKLRQFYNCLPLAIYLGSGTKNNYNFIQCCHGGIEIGFNPKNLLETDGSHAGIVVDCLKQAENFSKVCTPELSLFKRYFVNNKTITTGNGFMWNDFIVNPDEVLALSPRDGFNGTIFQFGQLITKKLLRMWSGKSYKVHSIFRAHQHGDSEMRNRILNIDRLGHPNDIGIGKLWIQGKIHKNSAERLDEVAVITFSVAPDAGYGWPVHSFGLLSMADDYSDWRLKVLYKHCRKSFVHNISTK